jgi:hypothetical protein
MLKDPVVILLIGLVVGLLLGFFLRAPRSDVPEPRIQSVTLHEGDIVIVKYEGVLSNEAAASIRDQMAAHLPNTKILVLSDGMSIDSVISRANACV